MTVQPPLAPGLPILGNTLALTKDLVGFIVEQYRQLGPIFRIRALNREMIVMAGPEANAFITQEGADKFTSREAWGPYGREFGVDDSLQVLEGETHNRYRKILKRGYSAGMMLANPGMMVDIAQKTLERFEVGQEVAALDLFRLIITEQLGVLLANHAPGDDLQHLIKATNVALNVHVVGTKPAFALRMPAYQKAKRRFLELGREILAEHRSGTHAQPDLVDDLLAASQESKNQDLLGSEEQLILAALGPFIAGLDTASNECTFMLHALLHHPDVLAACVEEADGLFANGVPEASQIRSLSVLHDAMLETLRLYSIGPAVTRNAAKDFDFGGYHVEKGKAMLLVSATPHFLDEVFADPLKFDITRYSEPRNEHKQRGAYQPFGIGTHICLGAGAAEVQIAMALASVLHMVRLEQVDPEQEVPIKQDSDADAGQEIPRANRRTASSC